MLMDIEFEKDLTYNLKELDWINENLDFSLI